MTEGYSGSDIANMTLESMFWPIRDLQTATFWSRRPDGQFIPCSEDTAGAVTAKLPSNQIVGREVNLSDFLKSIQTHRPTVSDSELQRFGDFTSKFGEKG